MFKILSRKIISASPKWDVVKISNRMVGAVPETQKEFAGKSILYKVENKVAYITLNRPERFNAIDENTPVELERAVKMANMDDDVKVNDLLSSR